MNTPITLYVSSNAPRSVGNDEVILYATVGGASYPKLFEIAVPRRHLARALAIDAAPFYSVGARLTDVADNVCEASDQDAEIEGEEIHI